MNHQNVRVVYEQPYKLENDGLSQTSTRHIHYSDDIHGPTKIKVNTHLPPFVLPSYWKDANLSEKDVNKMMEFIPSQLLWISCLVHGADVIAGCLKPSFQKNNEVCISYKKDALRTLISHLQFRFASKSTTMLSNNEHTEHIPPLPMQKIPENLIPSITKLLPLTEPKALQLCPVEGLLTLQNKRYLPIRLEGDAIYLQRATPYENYERSGKKQKYGLASVPFVVQTPDGINYALCEDGILIAAKHY